MNIHLSSQTLLLTLIGMMLVTYIPRLLPVWVLANRQLPPVVGKWLSYVPTAVLSALLVPGVLVHEGRLNISFDNLYLLAALPAFLVAWRTGSFFGTVAAGMVIVAVLRYMGL